MFFTALVDYKGIDFFYLRLFGVEERLKLLEFFGGEVVIIDFYFAKAYLWEFEPLEVLIELPEDLPFQPGLPSLSH